MTNKKRRQRITYEDPFFISSFNIAKGYIFSHNETFNATYQELGLKGQVSIIKDYLDYKIENEYNENEKLIIDLRNKKDLFNQSFKLVSEKQNLIQFLKSNMNKKTKENKTIGKKFNGWNSLKTFIQGESKKEHSKITNQSELQSYVDDLQKEFDKMLPPKEEEVFIYWKDYINYNDKIAEDIESLRKIANSEENKGQTNFSKEIKKSINGINLQLGWLLEPLTADVLNVSFKNLEKETLKNIIAKSIGTQKKLADITLTIPDIKTKVGINLKSALAKKNKEIQYKINRTISNPLKEFGEEEIQDQIIFLLVNLSFLKTSFLGLWGNAEGRETLKEINDLLYKVEVLNKLKDLYSIMEPSLKKGEGKDSLAIEDVMNFVIMTPEKVFWTDDVFESTNQEIFNSLNKSPYVLKTRGAEEGKQLFNEKRKFIRKHKQLFKNENGYDEGYQALKQLTADLYESKAAQIKQSMKLTYTVTLQEK